MKQNSQEDYLVLNVDNSKGNFVVNFKKKFGDNFLGSSNGILPAILQAITDIESKDNFVDNCADNSTGNSVVNFRNKSRDSIVGDSAYNSASNFTNNAVV